MWEEAGDIYGAYIACGCPGDIDDDGQRDLGDIGDMITILLVAGPPFVAPCDPCDCADMDSNGQIDLQDLDAMVNLLVDVGPPFIVPCPAAEGADF